MAIVGGAKTVARLNPDRRTANQMLAMSFRARTNAWVRAVGANMGVQSGEPAGQGRVAIYAMSTGVGAEPTTRLGQSNPFPVNTRMTSSTGGGQFEAALQSGVMIRAGTSYGAAAVVNRAWAITAATGNQVADGPGRTRTGVDVTATNLPSPFNANGVGARRAYTIWLEGTANRAPNVPQRVSPAHQQQVSSIRPWVEATFSDPNIPDGDFLNQYQLEVWNQAGTARVWPTNPATFTASTQERADRRLRRQVGVNLNLGTYELRCRVSDGFGVWSSWRRWHVEIIQGGSVEGVRLSQSSSTTVAVDRTTVQNPQAQYLPTHETALAVSQIQLAVRNAAGSLVRGASTIDRPNDTLGEWNSVAFPSISANWSPLPRGQQYRFEVRAFFADGNWSPWASSSLFWVNGSPNQPTNLSPTSNAVTTTRPELRATITDPDDAPDAVESRFFIRQLSTGTLRSMASQRLSGTTYAATPTTTNMPAVGDYEWYVRGEDTWGGVGTNSPTTGHLLRFRDPPVITVSSPASNATLTGSGSIPIAAESDTPLARWRARVRNTASNVEVLTGQWRALDGGTTISLNLNPVAWIRNDTSYLIGIEVETTDGLTHRVWRTVHVAYTPRPMLTDMTATPVQGKYDMGGETTQVHLTWGAYPGNLAAFEGYFVFRSGFDGPKAERIFLAHITDPAQLEMYDVTPTSGIAYEYSVTYLERVNQDEVESVPAIDEATVRLKSTVISAIRVWAGEQVNLPYWEDRIRSPQESASTFDTWSGDSVSYASLNRGTRYEGAFPLVEVVGANGGTAEEVMRDLLALNSPEEIVVDIDGVPESRMVPKQLCLRDPRGRKGFGTIERLELVDRHIGYGMVELSFVTNDYREDVDEAVDQW